jgi:hypothetical protein
MLYHSESSSVSSVLVPGLRYRTSPGARLRAALLARCSLAPAAFRTWNTAVLSTLMFFFAEGDQQSLHLPGKADIVRDTVPALLHPTGQSFTGHVGGHCQMLAFHKVTIEARPTLDAFAICVQNTPCPSPKPEGEHMA